MILFLAACTDGGKDAGGEGGDDGLGGVITAESGEVAELRSGVAWGVNAGGKAGIFVSPDAGASCDDAATYVSGADADWNPEVVSGEGVCNLYVRVDAYEGGELSLSDDVLATLVLNCAMDTGEWAFGERGTGDEGYYYSGPWWVGSPESYSLTLSGGDDEDLSLTVAMDAYSGSFVYDTANPDRDPASGDVGGSVVAGWCPDMGPALN